MIDDTQRMVIIGFMMLALLLLILFCPNKDDFHDED